MDVWIDGTVFSRAVFALHTRYCKFGQNPDKIKLFFLNFRSDERYQP